MADSLTTECGICNERYGDGLHTPRVLHSCAAEHGWKHTYCCQCLKIQLKDGLIICPRCRAEIVVKDGVDKLPVDADCLPQMSRQRTSLGNKLCTTCDTPASILCHPCGFWICTTCKDGHEQFKKKNNHKYIEIHMMTEEEKDTFKEILLCKLDEHDHYVINRYCLECKVDGCFNCMEENHRGHTTMSITDALATKKEQLTEHPEHKKEVEEELAQIKGRLDFLERIKDKSSTVIKTTFDKLREDLTCMEEKCQATNKDHSKEERTKLEDRISVLNKIKDLNDSSEQYMTNSSNISAVKRMEIMDDMKSTMDKYTEMPLMLFEQEMASKPPEFDPKEDIHAEFQSWLDNAIDLAWKGDGLPKRPVLPNTHNEICMLVVGKPKSSRGKMSHYLMKNEWRSDNEAPMRRACCKVWTHNHEDTRYRLVYTPGITNTQAKGGVKRESSDIAQLATPGPHVLLAVVNNPDEDITFLNEYRGMFSTDITRHLIIVFTGKKDLDKRRVPIQMYVQNRTGSVKNLVDTTDNRYIVCNPFDNNDEVRFRNELLAMVKKLVQDNEYAYVRLKN